MSKSIPVSLLAKWSEQGFTPNSIVEINNWYLSFENEADNSPELNSADELQLREQIYTRILKQIGRAQPVIDYFTP